ncbi:MAG: histidine phosphatase family protein [Propionibacteriaceae bacterium]
MKLLLIRHGQSENNALVETTGSDYLRSPDPTITELGVQQSHAIAKEITQNANYPRPTHLYSSLMRRTIETATPLAEALDLPIIARTDSYERPGPYQGTALTRSVHPGSPKSLLAGLTSRLILPADATEDGWYQGKLETTTDSESRAHRLLADLRSNHTDQDVIALVTHGWFINTLLSAAAGIAPPTWFHHCNTATTLLSWESGFRDDSGTILKNQLNLYWVNRYDHLTENMISGI